MTLLYVYAVTTLGNLVMALLYLLQCVLSFFASVLWCDLFITKRSVAIRRLAILNGRISTGVLPETLGPPIYEFIYVSCRFILTPVQIV